MGWQITKMDNVGIARQKHENVVSHRNYTAKILLIVIYFFSLFSYFFLAKFK